jgi:flotillin
MLIVVPFNQIHVVSRGKKIVTYDGRGRYMFIPFLHGRTIIPKHVIDVEPKLIKLHDQDNLPFGVEISVKVQVTDPQKAAAALTRIDHATVSKVVEDTVMSAARSLAMERNILDIMKKREEVEQAVYKMVENSLSKLGLTAIIFDIKNITDVEDSDVIVQLERVKIAELRKNARISESIHNNKAIEVEVEKRKESKVKMELMKKEEENARLERELENTSKLRMVEDEKLKIAELKSKKLAEIAHQQKLIEAQAEAEAIKLKVEAETEAIKLKAEAKADGIRKIGYAEADIIRKKAEAMEISNLAGQVKILEILSHAQIESAGKIAEALGKNNKIMYMPVDNNGNQNLLTRFVPQIDALLQSGLPAELSKLLGGVISGNKDKKRIPSELKNK